MELEELGGNGGGGETLTWLLDAVCAPGKGDLGGDGANSSDVTCVE
jgi:hypothetical protein